MTSPVIGPSVPGPRRRYAWTRLNLSQMYAPAVNPSWSNRHHERRSEAASPFASDRDRGSLLRHAGRDPDGYRERRQRVLHSDSRHCTHSHTFADTNTRYCTDRHFRSRRCSRMVGSNIQGRRNNLRPKSRPESHPISLFFESQLFSCVSLGFLDVSGGAIEL